MHTIQLRLSPREAASDAELRRLVALQLDLAPERIRSVQVRRRTIDARQRRVKVELRLDVYLDDEEPELDTFDDLHYRDVSEAPEAVIVGAGPAGLFAALRLIQHGVRPIVLERGASVLERRRHIQDIHRLGQINPESNYSYGEGGAGAFSDGKLYTRVKNREAVLHVLRTLCKHGADPKILIDAHPHIGTDKLPLIIQRIRERILASGGEVHFGACVTELLLEGKTRVRGVRCRDGAEYHGPVLLATGHSARDVYRYLHRIGAALQPKALAVGVRLEHPQALIDQIRYHSPKGRGPYLPAAEYVYKAQVRGRGVYSFCMCPGGFVIPASTSAGEMVVNGMSPANRGSRWANSGMVVELRPEDLPPIGGADDDASSPLAVMRWCEAYERLSFEAAERSLRAPAQRLDDFVRRRPSATLPSSSYSIGLTAGNLHDWMPDFITERLLEGFRAFERTSPGFLTGEAQLIGVESRTSSPVRIPRFAGGPQAYQHVELEGLYPVGEGAGYAGGIVSAAVDGGQAASALARQLLG